MPGVRAAFAADHPVDSCEVDVVQRSQPWLARKESSLNQSIFAGACEISEIPTTGTPGDDSKVNAMPEADVSGLAAMLGSVDAPVEVLRAAGAWLGEDLSGEGFIWIKSRQTLERRMGKRKEQIHLRSSKWNRAAEVIRFDGTLIVRDGNLAAWRRANPDLTISAGSNEDWVCSTQFGTLFPEFIQGGVALADPAHRLGQLSQFAAKIRHVALPWFGTTQAEPRLEDMPPATLDWCTAALIELMVCRDASEQARSLTLRWLGLGGWRQAAFDAGQELARQGLRPSPDRRGEAVGWSSVVLDLF